MTGANYLEARQHHRGHSKCEYTYSSQSICGGGVGSVDECVEEQIPRRVSGDVFLLRHSPGEYDSMGANTPRSHSVYQSRPSSLHPGSSRWVIFPIAAAATAAGRAPFARTQQPQIGSRYPAQYLNTRIARANERIRAAIAAVAVVVAQCNATLSHRLNVSRSILLSLLKLHNKMASSLVGKPCSLSKSGREA